MKRKKDTNLSILKASKTSYPKDPSKASIEIFNNPSPGSDYSVKFETSEFTSLCPVTNQPDFASVTVSYIPDKKCIESKSLKLYLFSFRNYKGFAESIANRICADLSRAALPKEMTVEMTFTVRGGLSINIKSSYKKKGNKIKK